jgi:hypothetical protein
LLWLRLSYSSIVKLPFVCVVAHDRKSRRWATAVNVNCLPGRAGGLLVMLVHPYSNPPERLRDGC